MIIEDDKVLSNSIAFALQNYEISISQYHNFANLSAGSCEVFIPPYISGYIGIKGYFSYNILFFTHFKIK